MARMENDLSEEHPIYTEEERKLSTNRGDPITQEMIDNFEYAEYRCNPTLRNEFLASNDYTLADVIGTVILGRVHMIEGYESFGPYLKNYWRRVSRRDSFKLAPIVCEAEGTMFEKNHS